MKMTTVPPHPPVHFLDRLSRTRDDEVTNSRVIQDKLSLSCRTSHEKIIRWTLSRPIPAVKCLAGADVIKNLLLNTDQSTNLTYVKLGRRVGEI